MLHGKKICMSLKSIFGIMQGNFGRALFRSNHGLPKNTTTAEKNVPAFNTMCRLVHAWLSIIAPVL